MENLSYFMHDSYPERETDSQPVAPEAEVKVFVSFRCVPEYIIFQNMPLFTGGVPLIYQAEQSQKKLLTYLNENKIPYKENYKGILRSPEEGDISWQYYQIRLSGEEFVNFKRAFSDAGDIKLFPLQYCFPEGDLKNFNRMVMEQAEYKAKIAAKETGATVGKLVRAEEPPAESQWTVYPPVTADFNYFDASMEGEFKVTFELLPL